MALAHRADAQYIAGKRARRETRRGMERVFHSAMVRVGFGDAMLVGIEHTIDDGDEINGWRVIHTPGHTPGHICLHRQDVLISGDLLMASAGGFQPAPAHTNVDPVAYRASLRRVAQLEFEIILPAHNPPYVVEAGARVREMVNNLPTKQ
jgi:glyoxylase-like metal-dependent hydrolase (beta-lactamase superfamily II)